MISLNKNLPNKYAYQRNGVIFDISFQDSGDACAVAIDSGNTPYILVKGKEYSEEGTRLYFNNYIADGDSYVSSGTGTTAKFKKVIHSTDESPDVEKTFQEYYSGLCETQIEESLLKYYTLPYSSFTENPDLLGIEKSMLNGSGYTTEGIEQIDFTEDYFNATKECGIKKQILKVAQNEAEYFSYKLTNPNDISGITISKIETE